MYMPAASKAGLLSCVAMTQRLVWISALVALACSMLIPLGASAQTVAAGPYYAPPAWDQKLPAATRFIVLSNWNYEAVLDRETGLVWERSPTQVARTWFQAVDYCGDLTTGGRKGWRLPTISELQSLVDPTQNAPALSVGHPFLGVLFSTSLAVHFYWSSTTTP